MMEPTDHDPTDAEGPPPPCPVCEGSRTVEVDVADMRGEHRTIVAPCPECGDHDERPDPEEDDGGDPWDDGYLDAYG